MHFSEVTRIVAAERLRHGLTQENLAEKVHLAPCYVSQIERGHRPPLGIVQIIAAGIAASPKPTLERNIGARLRAERLRAGLTIQGIERRMETDRSWITILERGLGKARLPGEIFRFLRAIEGKKAIVMHRLGGLDVIEADDRLVEIGKSLVACEALLARYRDADLEPPDSLILRRVGLRDGMSLYATLVQRTERRKHAKRGRVLKAKRRGWYWRNRFRVGEANRKRCRAMINSGMLDRPRYQSAS